MYVATSLQALSALVHLLICKLCSILWYTGVVNHCKLSSLEMCIIQEVLGIIRQGLTPTQTTEASTTTKQSKNLLCFAVHLNIYCSYKVNYALQ